MEENVSLLAGKAFGNTPLQIPNTKKLSKKLLPSNTKFNITTSMILLFSIILSCFHVFAHQQIKTTSFEYKKK